MWATQADLPEVTAFLRRHVAQSMFPLANLNAHGLNGDHPRAPNFIVQRHGKDITGVLCITREGMLMPQCPDLDWTGVADLLADRDLIGIIGPAGQARSLQAALGLNDVPTMLDHDEPQYALDLAQLIVPEGIGEIMPLTAADKDEMILWRRDYDVEVLNVPVETANKTAAQEYAGYCDTQSHVVLMDSGTALCTTGFNARLPDIVQIGGVYTPPDHRAKGHARRAVALHLLQAKAQGIRRATLFSANQNASRAYQAIGFTYIGQWTLCLFDGKQRIYE